MELESIAPKLIKKFNNAYNLSDTQQERFSLDLSRRDESFIGVMLGIMYAFTINPKYAENVVEYIINQEKKELFEPSLLGEAYQKVMQLSYKEKLNILPNYLKEQFEIIKSIYKRIPKIVLLNISKAAWHITKELNGNFPDLYKKCNYNGRKTIETMQSWKVRLQIKAFWIAREMRIQKVWKGEKGNLIPGEYCCVVDKQVRKALECLGVYRKNKDLFYHSKLIWQANLSGRRLESITIYLYSGSEEIFAVRRKI